MLVFRGRESDAVRFVPAILVFITRRMELVIIELVDDDLR